MAKTVEELEAQIKLYEQNGSAKLFYSLNKKMNEMADLMNKTNLSTLAIEDPKDKTFDRLKVIWNDASDLAIACKTLGELAGITNDEAKDTARKPFVDTIPEHRR